MGLEKEMLRNKMLAAVGFVVSPGLGARTQEKPPSLPPLPVLEKRNAGDLDELLNRRLIRVLVVPSRILHFVDKGTQRGTTCDALNQEKAGVKLGRR
jgi:hypothetical protein